MSRVYTNVLSEKDWYFARQINKPSPLLMVISEDVCGLTLVASWVRTDALVRLHDAPEEDESA